MKRIIYLLPIAALLMGVQSCCCDKDDDSAPVAAPAIQPNGDYPVDLGVSVRWATCNVGATTPEEYGDYYAWGDTATYYKPGYAQEHPQAHWKEGKTGYNWSSYKYCNGSGTTLTKYCSKSGYGDGGYTDSDTTLLYVDDVAHYKWGGNWRMPTKAEFKELLDSCDCNFTSQNGVNGLKVTSRKDASQSIFLPAAGWRDGTQLKDLGYCYYWSSSLNTNSPVDGWYLLFCSYAKYIEGNNRFPGLSIRPVCK